MDKEQLNKADDELFDFVCIESPRLSNLKNGLANKTMPNTETPNLPSKADSESWHFSDLKDQDQRSGPGLLQDLKEYYEEKRKRLLWTQLYIFVGTFLLSLAQLKLFLLWFNSKEVTNTMPIITLVYEAPQRIGNGNTHLCLIRNQEDEDYFFSEDEAPQKMIHGGQSLPVVRANMSLSSRVNVRQELLPGGKTRLLLEATSRPGLPTTIFDNAASNLEIRKGRGFRVVCDGERLVCKCFRVTILEPGRPPIFTRKCICEAMDEEQEAEYNQQIYGQELEHQENANKTALDQPKPSSLSTFVLAFNKNIRFSYFQLLKAGRILQKVVFTLQSSTKDIFLNFKVTIVELLTNPNLKANLRKEFINSGGKANSFAKAVKDSTSSNFVKAKVSVYQWSAEQGPKIREYWAHACKQLAAFRP